jgi:hypothetical protein
LEYVYEEKNFAKNNKKFLDDIQEAIDNPEITNVDSIIDGINNMITDLQ